ncbi:MAG: AsmA-like C-terminal domain-containing protein, partial [Pseudomonadota bacterium]|nr:AsmA-like C-terminal domain-containing protein [Pseudomonadota bacterium]
FVYISQAGGLSGLISKELSSRLGGVPVSVGDVGVEVRLPSFGVTLEATGVEIDPDGQRLVLPRVSAVFSPGTLLKGVPSEIVLSGLDFDLSLDSEKWRSSPLGLIAGAVGASSSSGAPDAQKTRQIVVEDARLRIHHPSDDAEPVFLENIQFEFAAAPDGTYVGLVEAERVIDGNSAGTLAVSAIGDLQDRDFRIDIAADDVLAIDLPAFSPMIPQALADAGRLSGTANLSITDSVLQSADIDLVAVGGMLDLRAGGLPKLDFDAASLVMGYRHAAGELSLAQGEVVLSDGRTISLAADLRDLGTAVPTLALRLRGNQWPVDQIYADWPADIASEARDELMRRATGGRLENFELEIRGGFQRSNARLEIVRLDLRSAVRGVLVNVGARQYEQLTGKADGNITLTLGRGGSVEAFSLSAGVSDGTLKVASNTAPFPLNRFQISASLADQKLILQDVSLTFMDGGGLGVSGDLFLDPQWAIRGAELTITSSAMEIGRLHAVWPEWLTSKTRSWVGEKMTSGRVEDIRLNVVGDFSGDKPRMTSIDGTVTMRGAHLKLSERLPKITSLDGRLTIVDNRGEIILTDGRVGGLVLSTGKVEILPVIGGKPAMGQVDLKLSGDVGEAISVAAGFGMGGTGGTDLTRVRASGPSNLIFRAGFPVKRKLAPGSVDFEVEGSVVGGTFTNLPLKADARDAEIRFAADRNGFLVKGDAIIFGLAAKIGYEASGEMARLDLSTTGSDLSRVSQIAASLGFAGTGGIALEDIKMSGLADVNVRAEFPTGRAPRRDEVDLEADVIVQQGAFAGLPLVGGARDADLVAHFSRSRTEVSGTARLFGASIDFVLDSDHEKDFLQVKANAPNAPGLAALASRLSGIEIGGGLGGKITLATGTNLEDFDVNLELDLGDASIDLPVLSWVKLPAEDGRVKTRLVLKGGRLVAIEDIDLSAGSMEAMGRAAFGTADDGTFGLVSASFERLTWPGNDIAKMTLTRDEENRWAITAEAAQIDLVPLRRNRGIGKGRPVTFDILADQIFVGDGIWLSGHVSGSKLGAGGGEASFSGNLIYDKRPLITESELQLSFGKGGDFVNGVGVIGGAETTLTYSAADGKMPELTLASENGGGALKGLQVTDTIRSGEMFLKTRFIDGYKNFDTNIRITNFTVVEAPTAVRAFSVLAPAGLYDLVEGEGTGFSWGEATIETRGSEVVLRQVTGQGQAVSVAFVGKYDRESRQADVSGNLVPASFLSQIIGVIPLVGEILTGVDNAGLFVTQFSVQGDIDDPSTSITPASIVPGVLRDLFSPAWLRREGDRILGPNADTANGS